MSLYDDVRSGGEPAWSPQAHFFYSWWLDQGNGKDTSFTDDIKTMATMPEEDLRALIFKYYMEDTWGTEAT